MLDVASSDTGTFSVADSDARPRRSRRRILVLTGARAVSDEFVAFVRSTTNKADVEHAIIPGLAAREGEQGWAGAVAGETRDAVFDLVHRHGITDIAVEWPRQAPQNLLDELCDCLLTLKHQGIRVHQLSHLCERVIGRLPLHSGSAWALIADSNYHFDRRWQVVKRASDVAAATCLLVLTAPLSIAAAAAIRATSPGPVLYRQERVGLGGQVFSIAKFRSMRVDAEKDGARFATHNDDRITPVGRVLRKTRIDELPQLWNVLKGEMSLIGPRPERPVFVESYRRTVPFYDLRHRVKPGLTGWAQIRDAYAASESETRSKLSRDLYYIKKGSAWMDLRIMVETAWVVTARRGSR